MKRSIRICAAALALCAAVALAACGTSAPKTHTEGADALAAMPADGYDSGCDERTIPDFLTQDQRDLYKAAQRIYVAYNYCSAWKPDSEKYFENEQQWRYIRDAAFADYDEYSALLHGVFTDEYAAKLEATEMIVRGDDGGVYFLDGGVGSNITYIDCTYELKSQTDDEIVYDVVARFNDFAMEEGGGDRADDTYETYTVTLKNTDGGWRFDNFVLPDAPGIG